MYRGSDTTTKDILIIGISHTMHTCHQLWEGVCINARTSYTSADITIGNTIHHCLYAYITPMQLRDLLMYSVLTVAFTSLLLLSQQRARSRWRSLLVLSHKAPRGSHHPQLRETVRPKGRRFDASNS